MNETTVSQSPAYVAEERIMTVWQTISHHYNKNDPRMSDMFLVSQPGTLIAILVFYNYFCTSLGPRYMKNRNPYSLRTTLIVYNLVQVLLSAYMVYEGLIAGWLFEYSYTCQPIDYSESPSALRMARVAHLYFVCKLVELLDTVFFVLRKKQRQISMLHLYHHISMPLLSWFGVRYFAGGHGTLFGLLNSFVHIIMYGYYMLAALGPEMQKYLWWKKYLTLLQILQFTIVGVHGAQTLFNGCDFPKPLSLLLMFQSIVFISMFSRFYINNHVKCRNGESDPKNPSNDTNKSLKRD